MSQQFKVIICCRNCQPWIEYTIKSLLNQTYKNWKALIIDDCSTDNTYEIVKGLVSSDDRLSLIRNEGIPKKVLQNTVEGIKVLKPQDEDVIVFLDGDDWLAGSYVLAYLAEVYADDNIWVTWGSYAHSSGKNPDLSIDYSKSIGSGWSKELDPNIRVRASWRFSHLRTCKYFLYKNVKDEDLRLRATGVYYSSAPDFAVMFPMVEMAGIEHGKFIPRVMYVYNLGHPEAWSNKKKQGINRACAGEITNREPYMKKTKAELLSG